MEKNNYHNNEQDRRLIVLEGHCATINDELGSIKVDMAGVKNDVGWLKKSYWVVVIASVGALIGAIINLVINNGPSN